MNKNYNTLHQYILENSIKEYHKETVNGLFRAILEPLIENQKFESCILFKLSDTSDKESIIKRLAFSGAVIYSYNDNLNFENIEKENIWKDTEFVIVIGQRYSTAMIWDYTLSSKNDYTPLCLIYNSKFITDIAKTILANTKKDIKDILLKYMPDRRENTILNKSINLIADKLNEKNEEIIFSELEKTKLLKDDDRLEVASVVAEKAKYIAHEIKNNLSVINLYSTIAQKRLNTVSADIEVMESLKTSVKNIQNASEAISNHINDLRCLSTPYKTNVNLNELILQIISQCEEKAHKSGVNIVYDEFKDIMVYTDAAKLQCAIVNVIFNAIEACQDGSEISIKVKKDNDNILIDIVNTGDMIPPEIQNKIFESDFTTKKTGSGLGLFICRYQLELSNGSINLLKSDEKETVFEITLPIK